MDATTPVEVATGVLPEHFRARPEIRTRSDLLDALTQAAELEHGLMVQYLFAAFTVRSRPAPDLSVETAEIARAAKRALLLVAREEMVHLGLVCNLLASLGSRPSFAPPAFPSANRYFPHFKNGRLEHLLFSLDPLGEETVARFVRFEAPRDSGELIEIESLEYTTVGDLYDQIERAIVEGEEHELFVGPRRRQETDAWGNRFRLDAIVDAPSAIRAIRRIVEDGEGTRAGAEDSHYGRFVEIQRRLRGIVAPVRPVGRNPTGAADAPVTPCVTPIVDAGVRDVLRLFNRLYVTTLLLLELLYRFPGELRSERPELRNAIRRSMSAVLRPLGETLTELPSGVPGRNAGPSFEKDEAFQVSDDASSALVVLHERLREDAHATRCLVAEGKPLHGRPEIAANVGLLARSLGHLRTRAGA